MKLLALELSTKKAGIVLLDDDRVLAEAAWEEARAQHEALFHHAPHVLKAAGLAVADIDLFVVGRGPGAFSGVRVALTAANAMALPFGKTVYAVSSGEALARDLLRNGASAKVAVVGDARRGTLWLGVFGKEGCVRPWSTIPADGLPGTIEPGTMVVSPDAERLAGVGLTVTAAWPTALQVASAARERLAAGIAGDPLEPLYMHPPV
jgi:tRNA threonylcarbamoyladenosine biosynthesis protein TsaB